MKILVVGSGYVGLVTGACFAEKGHQVICLDIDQEKIQLLNSGKAPFYEPGLETLVLKNIKNRRLTFTSNYEEALANSSLCFIAVATPSKADGSCDLGYYWNALSQIGKLMHQEMIIVNKSTLPIGTAEEAKKQLNTLLKKRRNNIPFHIVSNPEFLREGSAVQDSLYPDRIVLGLDHSTPEKILKELYLPFIKEESQLLIMDHASAELSKYAANAMLATRISFMNEMAALCEAFGANINHIKANMSKDPRIGKFYLDAGIGFGGSCLPKDVRALKFQFKQSLDRPSLLLEAVEKVNFEQRQNFKEKIVSYFENQGGISQKTLAIWGLSFKPNTDDLREAPSLYLIEQLLDQKALLRLYDPVAVPKVKALFPFHNDLCFCQDPYEAAQGADAILLLTEWTQLRELDLNKVRLLMCGSAFFDGRNLFRNDLMAEKEFDYFGIGVSKYDPTLSVLSEIVQDG